MKNKKAESQLTSFILTYGWAILVVLSSIGILAYLGLWDERPENIITQDYCEGYCGALNKTCESYDVEESTISCLEIINTSNDMNVSNTLYSVYMI